MSVHPSFPDPSDFDDATHGLIAPFPPGVIQTSSGKTVWSLQDYAFLHQPCPETANPKLWRQSQLCAKSGLFQVCPGIYQVRALDLSNVTFVESSHGVVVIDPLISVECAAAAWRLYQEHRGTRAIKGMIYSHSHGDHYMGAKGVLDDGCEPDMPILAPEGFIEAIMSESILAGPAMRQRAAYMYGNAIPRGPRGQIGTGLGLASSVGSTSLVPPNDLITATGEERTIDGVRIVFQMVPDTEAPSEMNFYFPDHRALLIAECAVHSMHNIVTLRGAQVRDAKAWSRYLDESLVLYGDRSDTLFSSHHWPTFGRDRLVQRLEEQRDLYAYLHDQTVRLMNLGLNGTEIAERIHFPPGLAKPWHCQGFYGSVSHNVKGIYQKYMTWFDGNAANLWRHPPAEEGKRYVDCMGGVDSVCAQAASYLHARDLRFAATLLDHALAASPDHARAKDLQATVFERLGYGAENATWRNFYLTAAQVLRIGQTAGMVAGGRTPLGPTLSVDQWLDITAVQLDGERAGEDHFSIDVMVVGEDEASRHGEWRVHLSHGALTYRRDAGQVGGAADLTMTVTRQQLLEGLRGDGLRTVRQEGDAGVWERLLDLTSVPQGSRRGPSQL
ncbi:Alkyl/aryl-sulfatase BDS1 [Teratosphaeria destructans]|uniref:Alkyl/aryl-sulfatase BDS1 n=1 Tax=Teratosphaeria destructans TaxID=418781 RepID=A0A9W7W5C4_9PEZI|nr:Alkyl/aryl-sulfatase BDS1 [Teratosphaeria destructans]